ncbi:MAG: helix-turn-helix domain-containing protein [Schwartzia sp.]|nr:helix-turn-helix domain-containing protein [Schwartzia sp. (in: firmicutes)]
MRREEIIEIARAAAKEALNRRDEIVKEEFDARYHDVKLLMNNYRKLKAHYAHISPETLEVSVICSMRRKTKLMMSHVDKMLLVYKDLCQAAITPDEARRWEAIYLRYIAEERMSIEDIAEKLGIDKRTFYRDVGRAMEDMAVLLFGIEAIGTWKPKK